MMNPSYTSPEMNPTQPTTTTKDESISSSSSLIDPNTTSLSTDYLEVHDSFNLTQDVTNNINSSNINSSRRSNIYVPPPNSKKLNTASLSPVKRYMMPKQTSLKR